MNCQTSDLLQMYRRYRMQVFILLLILIAALLLVFKSRMLTLAALAAALLYHFGFVRRQQKAYVSAFVRANLTQTLCPKFGMDSLSEKGASHITADTLKSARLMPFRQETGTPLFCWELHGKMREITVTLCDATLAQDFRLVEKGKKRVHFNAGVWAHLELPKDTGLNFRLLDETSVPTPIRMEFFSKESLCATAPLMDGELAKSFVLYHPVNRDAPALPGRFLTELKKLKGYTPGYVALSVHGSQMDVFIRGRFLARPVSVKQAPTDELVRFDSFPELLYLLDLASAL